MRILMIFYHMFLKISLKFNIPIEKSLKEDKKSRDKTVRMIWIITIFCYLMLVLKVGFNYWIYSIGLTILVINIFLLVMSRAEDNDDNDTENKAINRNTKRDDTGNRRKQYA